MVEVVAMSVGECILLWSEVVSGEVVGRAKSGSSGRKMRAIGKTGRAGRGRGNRTRRVGVVVTETSSLRIKGHDGRI